jgi:hypothetical protein
MNKKQKNEAKTQPVAEAISTEMAMQQTVGDFKNSVLVVSLLINLFVLTSWLVIEVTDVYNIALIMYLQN